MDAVSFDAAPLRLRIIASYWLVFLVGLPLWWATTSIERLALPAAAHAAAPDLRFPVHIALDAAPPGLAARVRTALAAEQDAHPAAWRGLDVVIQDAGPAPYRVALRAAGPALSLTGRTLHARTDQSASTIAAALAGLLAPLPRAHVAARYAPTYRLAFSLLHEDAAARGAAPVWDVRAGLQHALAPALAQLGALHNFTLESQVQFHAPLAFAPGHTRVLGAEDLAMFVNSADWTLASSVTEDPVLHFILFVPSRPLTIRTTPSPDPHTDTAPDAFLVPQWGGVAILAPAADPATAFHTFRAQLLALLGVAPLPRGVATTDAGLSAWQLDALLRRRARENTRDSAAALASIARLVAQIDGMPVGRAVRGDVAGALAALAQAHNATAAPGAALAHSARAHVLSSRAFFSPGMLALLYFPKEHKYAVYIPLFAPVGVPLVAAVVREVRRRRAGRV